MRLDPNNVLIYVEGVLKVSLDVESLTVEEGLEKDGIGKGACQRV